MDSAAARLSFGGGSSGLSPSLTVPAAPDESTEKWYVVPATARNPSGFGAWLGECHAATSFASDRSPDPLYTAAVAAKSVPSRLSEYIPLDGAVQLHHTDPQTPHVCP